MKPSPVGESSVITDTPTRPFPTAGLAVLWTVFTLLLLTASVGLAGSRDLILLSGPDQDQLPVLEEIGIVINGPRSNGWLVEATPHQQMVLRVLGWQLEMITPRVDQLYMENTHSELDDVRYLSYEEYRDSIIALARNHPAITRLDTLGYSVNGRLILGLKFSSDPLVDGIKPAVHFEGCIHGDEKISWAIMMEMVSYLATNYGDDTLITRLVNNREIWMAPLVNPDGYAASRPTRYNGRGVDLNRNWGWMWSNETRHQPGSSPMSEPESKALLNHILRRPFVMYISYHSGIEFISYPWSYCRSSVNSIPEDNLIRFLSERYGSHNDYAYGQGSDGMYTINGSIKDFNYGFDGSMAWSIEVHHTKTPPASHIIPTFNRNRDAILELIHLAGQGINGRVTDAATGKPIQALVRVGPADWQSYTHPETGRFFRFYLPGSYNLSFQAPGYRDTVITGVVVPASGDSSATVDVQLTPDPAAPLFGFRVMYTSHIANPATNPSYPTRTIGPRDDVSFQLDAGKYICIDMNRPLLNENGADFAVYRSSGTGRATVKISNCWEGPWTIIGTADNPENWFDLSTAGFDSVRYIRIEAMTAFQLDAIEGINRTGISHPDSAETLSRWLTVDRNPTANQVRFLLRQPNPTTGILIHSAAGRLINNLAVTDSEVIWNLTDERGIAIPAGVYFARRTDYPDRPISFVIWR